MEGTDLTAIGERIQRRRGQLGYTQEQIADKMNVSIQMISNLERGNKAIRIDNLVRLSQILKVSTDYILTGKGNAEDARALAERIAGLPEKSRKMIELLVDYCTDETEISPP